MFGQEHIQSFIVPFHFSLKRLSGDVSRVPPAYYVSSMYYSFQKYNQRD